MSARSRSTRPLASPATPRATRPRFETASTRGTFVGPARDRAFPASSSCGLCGKAALEVGKRLAQLAATQQVIVVTHLAQVAAFADQHIVVEKEVQGQRTLTRTRALTAKERATEVARMLSGVEESASATAHAAELLGLAAAARRVAG